MSLSSLMRNLYIICLIILYRVQQNGLNDTLLHENVDSVVSISQDEIYVIQMMGFGKSLINFS